MPSPRGASTAHRTSLWMPVVSVLTLGLAPYWPHPHIWKQLGNLFAGRLTATPVPWIDVFDLVMHGAPWVWLGWAIARRVRDGRRASTEKG